MKPLKIIITLLVCIVCSKQITSQNLHTNNTKQKEVKALTKMFQSVLWETKQEASNLKTFKIFPFVKRKFAGVLTTFSSDSVYLSRVVAPCGMDAFFAEHGKYKVLSPNKIAIQIDSIRYWGANKKPTIYPDEVTVYTIKREKDSTFIFIKQPEK